MRLFALLIILPLTATSAPTLKGVWHSDHDATMQFVKTRTLLDTRQIEFLDGLIGHLELSFDGANVHSTMPDFDVLIGYKSTHFSGFSDTNHYRLLGSDQDSVAILVENDHGRDRLLHFHFVTVDDLWLYSEEWPYGLRDDPHFREYFYRVK